MSEAPPSTLPPALATSALDPYLMSGLFNYAFMGIIVNQVYFYYVMFPMDRIALKALVFIILCINIAQTVISAHFARFVFVTNWGSVDGLLVKEWSFNALAPLTGSIAFVIQCFFAWRIWILGGPRKILIPIISIIVMAAVASFALSFLFGNSLNATFSKILKPVASQPTTLPITGWLITSLVCDVLITATLIIQLRTRKSEVFKSTNEVLHHASRMTLETGVLTSALAIAELWLYYASHDERYFALIIISGKVYSNSLLVSLNSRAPIFMRREPAEEAWQFQFSDSIGATHATISSSPIRFNQIDGHSRSAV